MRPTLYIVAKAPIMGRAKTRLARDIGPVHAKRLYRAMMAQVIRQVRDPRWDTVLAVTPPHLLGHVPDWDGLQQIPQVSGSLTPRLAALFARKGPTLTIGTDCPQVDATDIAAAFEALRHKRFVFGPADDGGFWLMGANGPLPGGFFDGVRWSHKETLSDVSERAGGSITTLRTLTDVDDLKALRQYRQSLRH
ncbi:TIGR04282 family arsenosugar biosynthesis glycosyltransferase [Litorimonas sp. WD9-15]|uniref:TIGR04282 family arsenosugar biosynthesis glycosyltransferase n=1 Tax=Litorimonas sp. WD9-15 TaxID=3418716 RepID=UPI003CFC0856